MEFEREKDRLNLCLNGNVLITHSNDEPAFFAGTGQSESNLHRGNFKVLDRTVERFPLEVVAVLDQAEHTQLSLKRSQSANTEVLISFDKKSDKIWVQLIDGDINKKDEYFNARLFIFQLPCAAIDFENSKVCLSLQVSFEICGNIYKKIKSLEIIQ